MKPALILFFVLFLAGSASAVSFDISQSKLNYSSVTAGSTSVLPLTLYVRSNKTMTATMKTDEDIAGWVTLNQTPVIIQPYTPTTIYVVLTVPDDAPHKTHQYKIYFSVMEYSQEGVMGVNIALRIPVAVSFDITGNWSSEVYAINEAIIRGDFKHKNLVLEESNNGDKLLITQYRLNISRDGYIIRDMLHEGRILPYSSTSTQLPLDTTNLGDGRYELYVSVVIKGKEHASLQMPFSIGEPQTEESTMETTTTTIETQATSTTTMPEAGTGTGSQILYVIVAVVLLLAVFITLRFYLRPRSR